MRIPTVFLLAITGMVAPLVAQDPQCDQNGGLASCTTCTPGQMNQLPTGASSTLMASPCTSDPPSSACADCCWKATFTFDPGTGSVNSNFTFSSSLPLSWLRHLP